MLNVWSLLISNYERADFMSISTKYEDDLPVVGIKIAVALFLSQEAMNTHEEQGWKLLWRFFAQHIFI